MKDTTLRNNIVIERHENGLSQAAMALKLAKKYGIVPRHYIMFERKGLLPKSKESKASLIKAIASELPKEKESIKEQRPIKESAPLAKVKNPNDLSHKGSELDREIDMDSLINLGPISTAKVLDVKPARTNPRFAPKPSVSSAHPKSNTNRKLQRGDAIIWPQDSEVAFHISSSGKVTQFK